MFRNYDKILQKAIIIYLLESKNFSVQSEVARSLNEEFKPDEDIEHFKKCLNLLTYTDTKHQGIYSTIRFRLKEITKSHPNIILDFIEIWVLNNKENLKSISALEGVIEELYITNPETLKKMFLDWLNSDNSLYKYAVPFIISNLKFESIGLHKESLKKVSETDSIYIAYMIVGHILDRKYATEMLYSILEVKYNNERVKNHIATIFVKYLIINFYSVTEILQKKSKSANKTIKSIIKQIINTSEQ